LRSQERDSSAARRRSLGKKRGRLWGVPLTIEKKNVGERLIEILHS